MLVKPGDTNVTTSFAMRLTADGTAATGLTPANFDLQYVRSGEVPVAKVDMVALAATNTAHTDNRGIEIDATDQPGLYRVDWPDAAFDTGVREVILSVKVATAFTEHLRVELEGPMDAIWDEVLTGGTHNINNSAGRRVRALEDATLIRGDTFQAGSTTTSLVLDASASAVDNFYNHTVIRIVDGTAAGQERIIADYNGTTKAATITPALVTAAPSSGDEFKIISGGSVHAETQGGAYEGGAVWIDTLDGVAGTLLYVNGTVDNPVASIADARTLANALGMHIFYSLPGSSFTLAQTFNDFEFIGAGYNVALGGQDIGGSRFSNCSVSGIGTGATRIVFRECLLSGATTLPVSSLLNCNLSADLTLSSTGIYRISDTVHGSAASPILDFSSAVGNTTVHLHNYHGAVTVKNMGQTGTDVLHFSSPDGKLTLDATCIAGTVNLNGTFDLVNSGSGQTLNQGGDVITIVDAIKVITDQFVFTKANEVDANTQSINGAAVVGDGNATPWDGV